MARGEIELENLMNKRRSYSHKVKDGHRILIIWTQLRCSQCGRFLGLYQQKYCSKCSKERQLAHVKNYYYNHNEKIKEYRKEHKDIWKLRKFVYNHINTISIGDII